MLNPKLEGVLQSIYQQESSYMLSYLSARIEEQIPTFLQVNNFRDFSPKMYFLHTVDLQLGDIALAQEYTRKVIERHQLLRARLICAPSENYFEVREHLSDMIPPAVDLSSFTEPEIDDFIYKVLPRYFLKNDNSKELLFRCVIVKRSDLRITVVFAMDDALHNQYEQDIISQDYKILVAGQTLPVEASYLKYIQLVRGSVNQQLPKNLEQSLTVFDEFSRYMYARLQQLPQQRNYQHFAVHFEKASRQNVLLATTQLLIKFFHELQIFHIPLWFYQDTRSNLGNSFSSTIGDFTDYVPVPISAYTSVERVVEKLSQHLSEVKKSEVHYMSRYWWGSDSSSDEAREIIGPITKTNSLILLKINSHYSSREEEKILDFDQNKELVVPRFGDGFFFFIDLRKDLLHVNIFSPVSLPFDLNEQWVSKSLSV
jgi:hypothetical protein